MPWHRIKTGRDEGSAGQKHAADCAFTITVCCVLGIVGCQPLSPRLGHDVLPPLRLNKEDDVGRVFD